jgi:hypothetical protein
MSPDLFDRQAGLPPSGEPSCDLVGAVAESRLRADCVLAEVDRSLALRAQDVTCERDRHRAGRCSMTPLLDLCSQVEEPGVAAFK